jgi:beta-lactamase class D
MILLHKPSLLLGLLLVGTASGSLNMATAVAQEPKSCTVILDARSGAVVHRDGICDERFSPASTFKVPLAVMGFDAGILKGAHDPAWAWHEGIEAPKRDRKTVDPMTWERDSVLWYSREVTRRLGFDRFASYVSQLDYGNKDISGNPGKNNGLTHAWLASSLVISADEQVRFVRKLLMDTLPLSKEAQAKTRAIVPGFDAPGGWRVYGKTGSIWLRDSKGEFDREQPIGWFVGWAQKRGQRVVFARLEIGKDGSAQAPKGLAVRALFLKELPRLMRRKSQ